MAKHRKLRVEYPFGGLNRSGAYRQQPPFTTTDMQNVRPYGTTEGRQRGGSRPGLVKSHRTDLVDEIRMLNSMDLVLGDGFTAWSDNFDGSSMAEAWTQASWASDAPLVLPSALASIDYSVADGAVVRDALPIDTGSTYTVEAYLVPWDAAWHGSYRLYLRMDNATPAYATDGVLVELTQTGTTGAYTASMKSYDGSAETEIDTDSGTITVKPGWLTAEVNGTTVTVYWNGVQILTGTVDVHTGTRVGFGLTCTVDGGMCLVNTFRAQYYTTGTVPLSRTMLVAASDGDVWTEQTYGTMTETTSDLKMRADEFLISSQSGQKLYIADFGVAESGTDGTIAGTTFDAASVADWTTNVNQYDYVVVLSNVTGATVAGTYEIASVAAGSITLASAPGDGTAKFRVERSVKVYDPSADTLTALIATAGQVPSGNPIIFRYLGRLGLAGGEVAPNAYYLSRVNDETDYDYSQEDAEAAVAGPASPAGVPGDPIKACMPTSDDYLVIACLHNIWRLRGDPGYGGQLDNLSETIGCVGRNAWCHGPSGEVVFLSLDGLYVIPPGGNTYPVSMSREVLPRELRNVDTANLEVQMAYDTQGRGVHIMLTPDDTNDRTHWWFDWGSKTFWNVTLDGDHEPTSMCVLKSDRVEDSAVLLGCRDGYLRRFYELAANDDGTAFTSYVVMGPISLNDDGLVGSIVSLDAVIGEESGDVTWSIMSALTFESLASASAVETGTWSAGLNATVRPSVRGQAFSLKIQASDNKAFAFESATAVTRQGGRRRIA